MSWICLFYLRYKKLQGSNRPHEQRIAITVPHPLRQLTGLMLLLLTCISRLPAAETIPVFNKVQSETQTGLYPLGRNTLLALHQLAEASPGHRIQHLLVGSSSTELIQIDRRPGATVSYVTYQQSYAGLPIWNYDWVLAIDSSGSAIQAYGELVTHLEQDLPWVERLSSHAQQRVIDAFIQQHYSDAERLFRNQESSQVIYLDAKRKAHNALKLSFFTDRINATSQPERPLVFIDVDTGAIIDKMDTLLHLIEVGGAGPSGNSKEPQPEYNAGLDGRDGQVPATFMLSKDDSNRCYMDALNVETRNAANLKAPGNEPFHFDCTRSTRNDHQTINEAKSPLNDAHFNAQVTRRMYQAYLGEPPYLDRKIIQHVHYGNRYDNAFYEDGQLYYGDGDYVFYPMTTLDVVSHEIAHGYTANYGRGPERLLVRGQARAINESFSDMSGAAAEFFYTGSDDWQNGQGVYKFGDALRYLDEPTRDGRSVDHLADFQVHNGEHYNAGIFNKAFHRLATSEIPWNTQYAFTLFALANQQCWFANTTFVQAADCAMQQAGVIATRLVNDTVLKPDGSYWTPSELQNQIRKAFAQVGIALITATDLESEFSISSRFNVVEFANTSRLNGLALDPDGWSYEWDFGDDSALSSELNPIHEFSTNGPHTVSLLVTEKNGSRQDRFSLLVTTHNDYCAASGSRFEKYFVQATRLHNRLTISANRGYSDFSANLIDLNQGQPLDYEIIPGDHPDTLGKDKKYELWLDINDDGEFQHTERLMSHYSTDGRVSGVIQYIGELNKTYRVRLLVSSLNSDKLPCGSYNSAEIEDYSIRWVNSDLNFIINTLVQENAIAFRNNTQDSRVTQWHWQFGDGTQSSEVSPYHRYAQSGDYRVTLRAYDALDEELGRWDSTVPVRNRTQATIVIDDISALTVTVSASMLRYPIGTQLLWQFDDGATANTDSAVHSYAGSGQYDISLSLTNADYPAGFTVIQQVSVGTTGLAKINPTFSYQKEFRPDGSVTVNFTNTTVDPKNKSFGLWSVTWDVADQGRIRADGTGLNQTTSKTFLSPGEYPATLTIRYRQSNAGGWSWVAQSVQRTLHLYPDPVDDYCPPLGDVTDEYIDQFTINNQGFTNGTVGGLVNPNKPIVLYSSEQNDFVVTAGYLNSDELKYAEHYHLWFDLNQDKVFGDGNWFEDKTERLAKEWDFSYTEDGINFGKGYVAGTISLPANALNQAVTRTRMRILQLYANGGDLEQLDPCSDYQYFGSYGEIEDYLVHLVTPYSLSVSVEQQGNKIAFTPLPIEHNAIATWQWQFGDGQSSNESNPVHQYSVPGRYQVALNVFSSEGYRLGNWQQWVVIPEPTVVRFDYTLSGKTIEVDGNPSQYPAGSTFVWDFGDNSGADQLVAEHTYNHTGTYKVSLTISNVLLPAGSSLSQEISISVAGGKKSGSWQPLQGVWLLVLLLFSRNQARHQIRSLYRFILHQGCRVNSWLKR